MRCVKNGRSSVVLLWCLLASGTGAADTGNQFRKIQEYGDQLFEDSRAQEALEEFLRLEPISLDPSSRLRTGIRVAKTYAQIAQMAAAGSPRNYESEIENYNKSVAGYEKLRIPSSKSSDESELVIRHGLDVLLWQSCEGLLQVFKEHQAAQPPQNTIEEKPLPLVCRTSSAEREFLRATQREQAVGPQKNSKSKPGDGYAELELDQQSYLADDTPAAFPLLLEISAIYTEQAKLAVKQCDETQAFGILKKARRYIEDYLALSQPSKDRMQAFLFRQVSLRLSEISLLKEQVLSCNVVKPCAICRDWRLWVPLAVGVTAGAVVTGVLIARPWETPSYDVYPPERSTFSGRLVLLTFPLGLARHAP